ncbi:MAG: class II glutamine amidotransferase [Bacteroidetes bacterium]|nr:class II glutamine amidotransferase [Bacteroidota bacterium]
MSEQIKHECGIAFIRLLQPLEYYYAKYGTSLYGLNKLYLLMEKQHNRGQDGAGMANIKFDLKPGNEYINIAKSNSESPIKDIFGQVYSSIQKIKDKNPDLLSDVNWMKENINFTGELFLGHLRYGTFGKNSLENIHPFVRANNWMSRNLVTAGNFNLTNVDELFNKLVRLGQHPLQTNDTITILEKIGKFLDDENQELFTKYKAEGNSHREISDLIAKDLNIQKILHRAAKYWDGGYVIAGLLGHGDAFVMRDPVGIRPAFYYQDDEVVVAASERPVIQTAFNVPFDSIKAIKPGHALIVKRSGRVEEVLFKQPSVDQKSCSFERIYFSRGTDAKIYKERKKLGRLLTPSLLKAVDYDIENTVFSYIPNTASVAFQGLVEGLNDFCKDVQKDRILEQGNKITPKKLDEILAIHPRIETIAVKDVKMRTFITQDKQRDDLVAHVYDVTYGVVKEGVDNLVVVDDSIVRGTTLKQSIIRILDRLGPKKIIIASSAPQIRYPDCYGIDMAKLGDFIAFKAVIALLKDTKQTHIINEVYKKSKIQENFPKEEIVNYVREIYKPFTIEQISQKIAELITPEGARAKVQIVYQTIEDLHHACPEDLGDWYFTGKYPTPGGNKVVNKSFINYIEGKNVRAY